MENTDRFYCPYPGCQRSFIDLWRLKVHYRADPDVRGSGRERGHGMELPECPKCRKALERGRHHVRCTAGRATPSQIFKRINDDNREDLSTEFPRKRRFLSRPTDSIACEAYGQALSWTNSDASMMPCNVRKCYAVSDNHMEELKLFSGHALFFPGEGNSSRAYFIPVGELPGYEER